MYRLVFLTGKMKGRRLAVQQGTLLIGRDPECQLDLADDDEVSRQHAVIEQRPDGIYIRDLGSMNPTEINGRSVKEWKLKPDDKIEIGRTVMQFQIIEEFRGGMKRSVSPLHIVTVIAILLLLGGQIAYWIIFPILQNSGYIPEPPQKIARTSTPAPVATPAITNVTPAQDILQAELDEAVAHVRAEEQTSVTGTPQSTEQMLSQVATLRSDLADLRKQVESISPATSAAPPTAATTPSPPPEPEAHPTPPPQTASNAAPPAPALAPPAPNAPEPPPSPSTDDILNSRAQDLLKDALSDVQRNNYVTADTLMERIQIMAPDFVPAYVERARLYETRGMLKKAGEQWTQVMNRTMGTPLYTQAAAERQRLARAEIMLTMRRDTPPTSGAAGAPPAAAPNLPRRIRIVSIERERFDASRDYDEMRIVRVAVKPRPSEGDVDTSDFSAVFTFYDKGLNSGKSLPTTAVVPRDPVRVEGRWRSGEQKTLTAAYLIPKGFRVDEQEETGERHAFEGVRIQLYYKDALQDEDAFPKNLLSLPSPPPPYLNLDAPVSR